MQVRNCNAHNNGRVRDVPAGETGTEGCSRFSRESVRRSTRSMEEGKSSGGAGGAGGDAPAGKDFGDSLPVPRGVFRVTKRLYVGYVRDLACALDACFSGDGCALSPRVPVCCAVLPRRCLMRWRRRRATATVSRTVRCAALGAVPPRWRRFLITSSRNCAAFHALAFYTQSLTFPPRRS